MSALIAKRFAFRVTGKKKMKADEGIPVVVKPTPNKMHDAQLPQGDSCVAVIFGATGDLTRRKLIPALFHLACLGCTSERFHILGVARQELSEEGFRAELRTDLVDSDNAEFREEQWQKFAPLIHYMAGDLDDDNTYRKLRAKLDDLETESATGRNRLFYLATPPSLAPGIVRGLGAAGLASEEKGWVRIVIEKPFGRDLASARALNNLVAAEFEESQIYRIDHYLGKETVQNILVFRFGNSLFEPVWNRNYVDYVEITAFESLGVGGRADYYDQTGALRDMVANHLLQLLALTAMEPPVAFDADSVREEKIQVWRSIPTMTSEEVVARTVRGQYGPGEIDGEPVQSYRGEKGVLEGSATETYVALELRIENWRWTGVPFYLRTGKRLVRPLTEIAVHLRHPPQAFFTQTLTNRPEPNVITFRIQPDEGITVSFHAKRPGAEMSTANVNLDFCYRDAFRVRLPTAYETLLLDVMSGDATLFTRRDGVEAQWRVITPIEEAWAQHAPPDFPNYAAGSDGPANAIELLARNGHSWRDVAESLGGCEE